MRSSFLSLLALLCLLMVAGCGAAQSGHAVTTTRTTTSTATAAMTPTEGLAPNSPWLKLWTLPALPPLPAGALPQIPQIAWSPANTQRLYLCLASLDYEAMLRTFGGSYDTVPAVLHDLYRSDDQGRHWTAYPLPEATGNCYLEVDPTNADALILLDGKYHAYFSRDGGQTWQPVPNPPHWTNLVFPAVQIMAGRLYVEGYWTADLIHWTRWYPVSNEQQHVLVQINPQQPQTLYTAIDPNEMRCAGIPSTVKPDSGPGYYEAQLCRSDDGGQTWRFLAVVVAMYNSSAAFCLTLNHPETLYAWGYAALSLPNSTPAVGTGDAIQSTDGGTTWTRLPTIFTSGEGTNLSCGSDAYGGQSPLKVESDYPVDTSAWGSIGITADGTFYHIVDTTGTRGGIRMTKGISLLTDTGWKVVAPYPDGVTTPATNYRLRMLLMTPSAGSHVLLAFTDQQVYEYSLSSR